MSGVGAFAPDLGGMRTVPTPNFQDYRDRRVQFVFYRNASPQICAPIPLSFGNGGSDQYFVVDINVGDTDPYENRLHVGTYALQGNPNGHWPGAEIRTGSYAATPDGGRMETASWTSVTGHIELAEINGSGAGAGSFVASMADRRGDGGVADLTGTFRTATRCGGE